MIQPDPAQSAMQFFRYLLFILIILLGCSANPLLAATPRIAVASNFAHAMKSLAAQYKKESGQEIVLAFGSTGKHYAQIYHGAPFDAFFAADVRHPRLLEEKGIGIQGSRFTYAIGQLALWSASKGFVDDAGRVLQQGGFRHLAIANPKLAPYGLAARQVLQGRQLFTTLESRLIFGENISQTYQFIASGNAELGFVAWPQLKRPNHTIQGSYWLVPQNLYTPIEQQALLLTDNRVARDFIHFVQSPVGQKIILAHGYTLAKK